MSWATDVDGRELLDGVTVPIVTPIDAVGRPDAEAVERQLAGLADAGITKQTLYEVSRDQFTRSTYDRAIEALDNVNGEIEQLVRSAWGRA